jgi:hypothetical protein
MRLNTLVCITGVAFKLVTDCNSLKLTKSKKDLPYPRVWHFGGRTKQIIGHVVAKTYTNKRSMHGRRQFVAPSATS